MESDLFSNLEEISANENYSIFKAIRTTDSLPVILKKIKDNSKRKNLRERLLNEREIATIISKPWADRVIDFLEEPEVALVFQDGGEISLRQYYSGKIQNLDEFLDFSISISKKLFQIHENKILHRDIKPSNILYDKIKKDYILIDFGLSRKHSRNFSEDNRSILEGTPEFISPEATGRTGNSEDYRSDLYSLGITFYELLTGRLPFPFQDPLKLIHAHLATPAHFSEEDSLYPILKKVVLKLLEKSPSLRYQSAYGLWMDLLKIKDCPIANRNELNFPLGEEDSSMDFILPKKLYGRENEISLLLRNFETIKSGEVRTTLIAGFSGIGKSALINVLQAPISENKGYFLSGKFEQYRQNTPFFAILQILRNFLRLLYLEKEDIVVRIQNKIIESLGEIGGVITKLLPEYENFLGEQSILPELSPSQESNRFRLGLERLFLGITGDIPLVFFMDDLQWADSASLEILKNLLQSSDLRSIYFLFAYRNNEVDETHPFIRMLQELNKEGIHPETILIEPLSLVATNELISDALRRKKEETEDLTLVVHSRTEGNPFFIHQFLYSLYDKNIIVLHKNHYIYSLSRISSMQVEDSVVDLMLGRIEKLPPDSREILSAVSCMGSSVEFMHLHFVLQISNLPELLSPILE
ncbi:MAG: serine/threonine-protein kinase PknK, partial [Spirochaetia bacterium]|nr:serine/threonine-protein kinase PknK [Spirochaetia bacterium]